MYTVNCAPYLLLIRYSIVCSQYNIVDLASSFWSLQLKLPVAACWGLLLFCFLSFLCFFFLCCFRFQVSGSRFRLQWIKEEEWKGKMRERDEGRWTRQFSLRPPSAPLLFHSKFCYGGQIDPMVFVGWTQKYQHQQTSFINNHTCTRTAHQY